VLCGVVSMRMRPSFGSSGLGVSRGIGGGDRSVTVSGNERGVTVGINVGIAEVGITTDYGGGGKIGFGGQSVTWGLEGGKIQMGIAGFELIVEARNCVVTEVKKIAGMTVSSRTYPDPGCKDVEPKPPEKPKQPEVPQDLSPIIPVGLDENVFGYVLCNKIRKWKREIVFTGGSFYGKKTGILDPGDFYSFTDIKITGKIPDPVPAYVGGFWPPFTVESTDSVEASYMETYQSYGGVTVQLGDWVVNPSLATTKYKDRSRYSQYSFGVFQPFPNRGSIFTVALNSTFEILESLNVPGRGEWPPGSGNFLIYYATGTPETSFCLYGELPLIRDWIIQENKKPSAMFVGQGYDYNQIRVAEIVKVGKQSPVNPPRGGNRPPMNSSCCKEVLADLEDLKEVFAVEEMLKGQCSFPWRLRMPGGQGEEKIYDYANYLRALAQEIDHLGIHPPKLFIQDINNAQEGDQIIDLKFPSATSAFEALMKQVWDDNADGDTRTNFLYRLAWLAIQNQEATIKLSAKVHAIADALGIELESDTAKFPVPFNIGAGIQQKSTKGQGFGKETKQPQIDSRIDINSELATESLLPEFLKCRENEVLIERFSGNKDIMDMLSLILFHLEKLNSK
jgi:hypothetical protein